VLGGVLPGKGECCDNRKSSGFEDFSVVVKARKSVLDFLEMMFGDDMAANRIAEFQKRTKCANDFRRNVPFNCGNVDLKRDGEVRHRDGLFRRYDTYLHQGLWIVTSPLLEATALWEASQACEWGNDSNPRKIVVDHHAIVYSDLPPINIIKDVLSSFLSVLGLEIELYPINKVVFKTPFDELV
jgi:hypothetical protein